MKTEHGKLDRVYHLFAEIYGFTPEQVDHMTDSQIRLFLGTTPAQVYRLREAWFDMILCVAHATRIDRIYQWLTSIIQRLHQRFSNGHRQ